MSVVAAKLFLAPALIAAATLVTRKYGLRAGGLIATLPAAAGPILLVLALEEGEAFTADAAQSALLGIVALNAFIVVYCLVCRHSGWIVSLLVGWAAFFAAIVPLQAVHPNAEVSLVIAFVANSITLLVVGRLPIDEPVTIPDPPSWDIPARALSAVAMIVVITGLAAALGPDLTGLLTPFPIIASVLAAFTHASGGSSATIQLTRAFCVGLYSFSVFFYVLATQLVALGIAVGFLVAIAVTLVVQVVAFSIKLPDKSARAAVD